MTRWSGTGTPSCCSRAWWCRDRERARELLAEAVDGYRRLGMELPRPEAERLLATLV